MRRRRRRNPETAQAKGLRQNAIDLESGRDGSGAAHRRGTPAGTTKQVASVAISQVPRTDGAMRITASPHFYCAALTMQKTTPLNPIHRAAGARMVDFGGWDMPVHYGSQIDEHHAVRRDAGMFDVSHMRVVDIHGAARDFLRYALANNVDKLKTPGKALYSCMLEQHGFVVDDLIVYFLAEDHFRLVVNAATADKDIAWLAKLGETHGFGVALAPRS